MNKIKKLFEKIKNGKSDRAEIKKYFNLFLDALEKGKIRSAEKINNEWVVNFYVKESILLGFKYGKLKMVKGGYTNFMDKEFYPLQNKTLKTGVRMLPGGSAIRRGSYVSDGTVIIPPTYVNIGAYVDSGCMLDSHSLVGSCAQIGKNVHLSAASQIGGVLEPVGALPVIIEDNVFIGGNCGIYEGTIVRKNAVIATGVILNSSIPIYDSTTEKFLKKNSNNTNEIPEGAVVISGSRRLSTKSGMKNGISIYCPVIIKYRDEKTGSSINLEELLR
ncbi:MAG TPA: 2,3,4,5-tetrahydropyridine-2,6-dicarboxylate N-succinyltransferase [Ignavibacteria bacterium]|nr:2,3,4,5-tetrahydropyridine-2,6-dicarboxylate N-succinyltransferase [Ignavibacteria bacterium]